MCTCVRRIHFAYRFRTTICHYDVVYGSVEKGTNAAGTRQYNIVEYGKY